MCANHRKRESYFQKYINCLNFRLRAETCRSRQRQGVTLALLRTVKFGHNLPFPDA
jgi:hypothetical protein